MRREFAIRHFAVLLAGLFAVSLGMSAPAKADQAQIRITSDANLRFGTFAVADRGYRIVSPAGAVQSSGVFSTASGDTAPARFTISYDRGNNSRRNLTLQIQLVMSAAPVITQQGIIARLSVYQTDLPGAASVQAGQIVNVTIPNCVQRVCSRSFNVGGRLDVERSFGGGIVELAIPVDVVVVSVR